MPRHRCKMCRPARVMLGEIPRWCCAQRDWLLSLREFQSCLSAPRKGAEDLSSRWQESSRRLNARVPRHHHRESIRLSSSPNPIGVPPWLWATWSRSEWVTMNWMTAFLWQLQMRKSYRALWLTALLQSSAHLCPPTAIGWKAGATHQSKPCWATTAFAGRDYSAAGQAASALHSMAVLQVFQAKMLSSEEAGLDSASLRDQPLHSVQSPGHSAFRAHQINAVWVKSRKRNYSVTISNLSSLRYGNEYCVPDRAMNCTPRLLPSKKSEMQRLEQLII